MSWVPHRAPTDQQAEAFRRWLETQDVSVKAGTRVIVAGVAWTLTRDKDLPHG